MSDEDKPPTDEAMPSPWHVVRRVQAYRGEERANLLRIIGIAAFYVVELLNHHGLDLGFVTFEKVDGVDGDFHAAITALTVAWVAIAAGVLVLMRNRVFPPALKYVTTTFDVIALTGMLTIADGPSSPLVIGYFLVLVIAPLRFSLPLVRYATGLVLLGYVLLLVQTELARPTLQVPRYQQVMMGLALLLSGVVLGQLVRAMRDAAETFAARAGASS